MTKTEKLIFFKGGVETLSFFSRAMADTLEEKGYRIFFYDISGREKDFAHLSKFIKLENTAVITFNFIGLSGEGFLDEPAGRSIFVSRKLPVYCIMVDHPLYYHKQLSIYEEYLAAASHFLEESKRMKLTVFCIDREHVEYMKRFYPTIPAHFLPLAGNLSTDRNLPKETVNARHSEMESQGVNPTMNPANPTDKAQMNSFDLRSTWIPYDTRPYDVAFIANYVALPKLAEHFANQGQEYIDFYYEILKYFKEHPSENLTDVFEQFVKREIPKASDEEMAGAFEGMRFLDLYNRTYYRGKTIKALADGGVKVHVFGKDWDKLEVKHPENLIMNGGQIDSTGCVEVLRNAKIALNTMPWFKDGAHDRIFTAMLNGAVSLTDSSRYLKERFTDGEELRFYELNRLEELPEIVTDMLNHPKEMQAMAERAYKAVKEKDTWAQRADAIASYFR